MKHNQDGSLFAAILITFVVVGIGIFAYQRVSHNKPVIDLNKPRETSSTNNAKAINPVDETKIPLGDDNVSTMPKSGYVMSCSTNFRTGGAQHSGPWISGNTWNSVSKPSVSGDVSWPNASVNIQVQGSQRVINTNDLPNNHGTGIFPISKSESVYQYDTNPNSIIPQSVTTSLAANPSNASKPSCVPMGAIGYLTNGVEIYNALDAAGKDAAAHEVQDKCDGHPQKQGAYHYHNLSKCIADKAKDGDLIGYALDGYGIYIEKDSKGNLLTNAELDECHGRTSSVLWEGKMSNIYHYNMTKEYPYSVGCFRGTPISLSTNKPAL